MESLFIISQKVVKSLVHGVSSFIRNTLKKKILIPILKCMKLTISRGFEDW